MIDSHQLVESVKEIVRLVEYLTEELDGGKAPRPETPEQERKRRDPRHEPDTAVMTSKDPKRAPVDLDLLSFIGPGTVQPTASQDQVGPVPARAILFSWCKAFGLFIPRRNPSIVVLGAVLSHEIPGLVELGHPGLEEFSEEIAALRKQARAYAGEPIYISTTQAAELLAVTDRTVRRYAETNNWVNYGLPSRPKWDIGEVFRK